MRSTIIRGVAVSLLAAFLVAGREPGHAQNKPVAKALTIEEHRNAMQEIAKTLEAGSYYSEAQVPVALKKYREHMLAIVNIARADPDFRKNNGAKMATDLSGDTVGVKRFDKVSVDKIYKHSQTAPYFKPLVLNENLCQASQFQVEYVAANKIKGLDTHKGPNDYKGADMTGVKARAGYFGYKGNVGEGLGMASPGPKQPPSTAYPLQWTKGDTHFFPFFNIGNDVEEIGFGMARGPDGRWCWAYVFGGNK